MQARCAANNCSNVYRQLVRSVSRVLRAPGLTAPKGTPAFYDGQHGLRVIVKSAGRPTTPERAGALWAEVWMSGPRTRRASIHSPLDAVVIEYDVDTREVRLVQNDGFTEDELRYLFSVSSEEMRG